TVGRQVVRRGWRIGCPPRSSRIPASLRASADITQPSAAGVASARGRVGFRAMPSNSPFAGEWTIDPAVDFLNHGCYGCCPRAVRGGQAEMGAEMGRQTPEDV